MRGGRAMFAAFCAPTPLERLLAAARVALQLLADALRSSTDPQDTPVLTLGHHLISCRDVAPEGAHEEGCICVGIVGPSCAPTSCVRCRPSRPLGTR